METCLTMSSFSAAPLHLMPNPQTGKARESILGNATVTPKRKPQRRTFNCLPCREHKVKCNRAVPCENCMRHDREDLCRKHPALMRIASSANPRFSRAPTPTAPVAQRQYPLAQESGNMIWNRVIDSSSSASSQQEPNSAPAPCTATRQVIQLGLNDNGNNSSPSGSDPRNTDASALPVSVRDYMSIQTTCPVDRTRFPCEQDVAAVVVQPSTTATHALALTPPLDLACDALCMSHTTSIFDPRQLRCHLVKALPTQSQCDVLISFFLDNVNYIYQVIHVPTFRQTCAAFWDSKVHDISISWLSLLFAVLSVAVLYLPREVGELVDFDGAKMAQLSKLWYMASRQCVLAGGEEAKPNLLQLQTFLTLQSYWLSMEDMETLNSCLAQAVRAAQSIGLDMDTSTATSAESEMRHRIWWEICTADTFQSICLNRTSLIQSRLSKVPLPSNCNDIDISLGKLAPRASSEPTEASFNILRSEATRILNRLFQHGPAQPSYELAKSIDADLLALTYQFPWNNELRSGWFEQNHFFATLPRALNALPWQCHLFHAFLCVQRMRLYRPFLESGGPSAKQAVLSAATDAFAVYRTIRDQHAENLPPIRHRFAMHTYQIFSTAISLVLFVAKERLPEPAALKICADVEMVAADLEYLGERRISVPLAVHGSRILRHILALHDTRCPEDDFVLVSLILSVYSVIGGKDRTREYLERHRPAAATLNSDGCNHDEGDDDSWLLSPTTFKAWDQSTSSVDAGGGYLQDYIDSSFWEHFGYN